jgi:hypothetical protein
MISSELLTTLKVLSIASMDYVIDADLEDQEAYINDLYNVLHKLSKSINKEDYSSIEYKFPLELKLSYYEENHVHGHEITEVSFSTYVFLPEEEFINIMHRSYMDNTKYSFDTTKEVYNNLEFNSWFYSKDRLIQSDKLTQLEVDIAKKTLITCQL